MVIAIRRAGMNGAADLFPSMSRIRLKRIGLSLAAAVAGGGVVWFFFFPVPVGGLVRFAADRAGPAAGGIVVRLEGATFRWRRGEPDLRLDLRGLVVRRHGEPLAEAAGVTVDLGKRAWWSSGYAPTRVGIDGARCHIDLRPAAGGTAPAVPPAGAGSAGSPWAALEAALAPLAALWPVDGAASVLQADGLRAVLRTAAGEAEWRFARLEARARRAGSEIEAGLEVGPAGVDAPPAEFRARWAPGARRLAATMRVPRWSTPNLPRWPGQGGFPLQAQVEASGEVEVNLAAGEVVRGAGSVKVADGALTLPGLGAPIPIPRAVLRARADGEPLRITVEEAVLEVAGARLAADRLVAVLGAAPRLEGGAVLQDVSAAAWLALLPADLRKQLPVDAGAVAELWLRRATIAGAVELRAPRDGTWNPRALRADGLIVAANAGRELAVSWEAEQGGDGVTTVRAALPPLVPADWGGAMAKDSALAALRLPMAARVEATIEAVGDLRGATVEVTAAAGTIGAWGPLSHAITVKQGAVRAELADGGRRLRVPRLEFETDGPRIALDDIDIAWPRGRPVAVHGRARVSALTAAWMEPWLPRGALAPLPQHGLAPGDVGIAEATATWAGELAETAGGGFKPVGGTVKLELQTALHRTALPATAEARWLPAEERIGLDWRVGPFEPAALPVVLPPGMPPLVHAALPVALHGSARVSLAGAVSGVRFGVEAGPGVIRALPQWPVDLPLRRLRWEGTMGADGRSATIEALEVTLGSGLTFGGRALAWQAEGAPTASGELSLGAMDTAVLLPLLPPGLRAATADVVQAAELRGARLRFAASPDAKAPGGWRIAELHGEVRVREIAAKVPGAGAIGVAEAVAEVEYPRARLTLGGVTAPAHFGGAADATVEIDAARPEALRGSLRLEAGRVRLPAPEFAAVPLFGAPLRLDAVQAGTGTVDFEVESAAVLGRALRVQGRAEQATNGARRVAVARLDFGGSALGVAWTEAAGAARALRVKGTRLAVDELGQTVAPFLARPGGATVAAAMGPAEAGGPVRSDAAGAAGPDVDVEVQFDAVTLGGGKVLGDVRANARVRGGWPEQADVDAREGAGNRLRFALGAAAAGAAQTVTLGIDDASAWVAALTTPLRTTPLPGDLAATVTTLAQVPAIASGGRVDLAGELAGRTRFTGRLSVAQATMVQPPRILQLLALKSGKALQQRPLLERLTIERVTADEGAIALDGVTLAGTGLIDRLKLGSARYEFATQRVAADGQYFGVGFEVVGTRADPQVFLKDSSLLVRTVGQRNEFDFEAMAREAEEAKAKAAGKTP